MYKPYGVYALTDSAGRVMAINSDAHLSSIEGWTKIDEGQGDRFHHAQGNYLDGPMTDKRGIWRYKLEEGRIVERTQDEMDADYTEHKPQPTNEERIAALEDQNAFLTECLLEMSEAVYA